MEIKRQKYMEEIINKMSLLKNKIEFNTTLGLTDTAIWLEDLMCGLLNLLYEYELINLNDTKQNRYPGIDLADEKNA